MQEWSPRGTTFNLGDESSLLAGAERGQFCMELHDLAHCFRVDLDHALLDIIPELGEAL
jgi:hypothetical protein